MLAEIVVRVGHLLVDKYPPEGRDYWSGRFWNREEAESHPVLGYHFLTQKEELIDLIKKYGGGVDRVIEFACGTGEFTRVVAGLTSVREIVAVDISKHALEIAATRARHPGLTFQRHDFWTEGDLGDAELVVCIDAIHHLGDVRQVLQRLKTFAKSGGVVIGNIWTFDHFHEYQRQRYGAMRHLGRSALFLANALIMRISGGRLRWASYRTQILPSREIHKILHETFAEVLHAGSSRHWIAFACRC